MFLLSTYSRGFAYGILPTDRFGMSPQPSVIFPSDQGKRMAMLSVLCPLWLAALGDNR
jgi:hypothetical protein